MLGEYAALRDYDGLKDADVNYYSTSVIARIYEDWNVTGGYTFRDIDNDGSGASFNDHLLQISGGYDFQNGFTAEAGWRNSEELETDTDIVGFLIRYTKEL